MVEEPVEDGGCEDLVAEHLAPFAEGLVRGQDDGALLVALRDDLEDQVCLGSFEGLVADFVNDENAGPQVGAELVRQPSGASAVLRLRTMSSRLVK
jgi:hypothetical protein